MPPRTVEETQPEGVAPLASTVWTEELHSRPRGRWQLTFALAGIMLPLLALNTVEGFAIAALPRAIADLNGFSRYAWPSTSFLLTSTITMPVFAKLSDLYGKWFYLFGAAMCIAYAALCGSAGALPILSDGMSQIVAGSALLGLGHAAIMVLSFTLVADLYPPLERGRYQCLLAAVSIFPFVVGPSLGGWFTDHLSWRWAYYVNVPLGAIAMVRSSSRFQAFNRAGRAAPSIGPEYPFSAAGWRHCYSRSHGLARAAGRHR
jgi:MFS family permease